MTWFPPPRSRPKESSWSHTCAYTRIDCVTRGLEQRAEQVSVTWHRLSGFTAIEERVDINPGQSCGQCRFDEMVLTAR